MNKLLKLDLLVNRRAPGLENFANAFPPQIHNQFLTAVPYFESGETGSYDSLSFLKYGQDSRSLIHIIC